MEKKVYSVGELTASIKHLLENSLPTIWLQGEISNFKNHYSGHLYFSLKDDRAQISAVMWRIRAQQLPFQLEDGQQVQVLGNIRLYEKSGRYQIDVVQIMEVGAGELQLAFERLKKKLLAEGLFDIERKRPIPRFPLTIAVITSPTGAAIRDILNVLKRRAPYAHVIIRPAKVQGIGAAKDIAKGIEGVNTQTNADVMIIGRGGGSLEDLWAFNEEVVARAIVASHIPVVSAVGHEVDFSISDFCADMRAPTPSAAAELITEDAGALRDSLLGIDERLMNAMTNEIREYRARLQSYLKSYGLRRLEDMIYQYQNRVSDIQAQLVGRIKQIVQERRTIVYGIQQSLNNLNPKNILKRGYSLTLFQGEILRDIEQLKKGASITTLLQNGSIESIVEHLKSEVRDGEKDTI